ncbi:MAG: hypothetical protein A2V86_10835 [Deltaproteobacteria bacterium RBG_16_49_23]|nr:MAG: hypothetical protein A2V86_10835 [Deltaproteobacteria bacterium RBG_16_49_23]
MVMRQHLNQFLAELKSLRNGIKSDRAKTVNKIATRKKAEGLATSWLSTHSSQLLSAGQISTDMLDKYSDLFRQLLKITGPSNLSASYLKLLNAIIKSFREDIILVLHEQPPTSASLALLTTLFKGLPSDEDTYLKEATGCALKGFLRASVVLGWCAAISRIHAKIEEIGFATFNVTSAQMASQQKGRFKRFNKVFNLSSIGDLNEVFDNDTLWVLEGMQIIDSNQHTRLHSCFEMRCQSAHPGEAPITEFNLLSFFSDLKEIVFDNPKLSRTSKAPTTASTGP